MKYWVLGILGAMLLMNQKKPKVVSSAGNPMDARYEPIRKVILAAAKKYGVPPRVALAFAWIESRFDTKAAGDKQWAEWDDGARYKKNVLENPALAKNPYRNTPAVWHSYGLFQLLAPYFVTGSESPNILYLPEINADRGVKKIANSLKATKGNVQEARILYAGAANLSAETKNNIAAKITAVLKLFPENVG